MEPADESVLDAVYTRRFRNTDRARFETVRCEVARIVRVSPNTLNENDELEELARSASSVPHAVMDELAELVVDESTGVPERHLTTVGELLDWVLANPR